jgi:hypothetical protein
VTGKIQQPSGLDRGLPLIISAQWTPEQAWAVFELLDDLREAIWNHYAADIQDLARDQRAPDGQNLSQPDR